MFTSRDTGIATVSSSGIVTGVKTGTTIIDVEMSGYNKVSIPVEIIKTHIITVNPMTISVNSGDAIIIDVEVDGVPVAIKDVVLSTGDSAVVLIDPATNDILAGNVGNTTITVEYKNAVPVDVNVEVL